MIDLFSIIFYYLMFAMLCFCVSFFIEFGIDGKKETKKEQGKIFLKSLFWIFMLPYYIILGIIYFIKWFFECMIALFENEESEQKHLELLEKEKEYEKSLKQAEEIVSSFTNSYYRYDIALPQVQVQKDDVCGHCGSGKQYNGNCSQCGAPIS